MNDGPVDPAQGGHGRDSGPAGSGPHTVVAAGSHMSDESTLPISRLPGADVAPREPLPLPGDPLLRRVLDRLSAMVAYWDTGLRCRFANRAYERWFGVKPEDLLGRHISELLGPSLYASNLPYIEGALRGHAQEFEREIPDPNGGPPRYSLANYFPDVADGVVRGFFVLVTDISAIKRAEMALRETEERFRLTLDEAPIGMALVSVKGDFLRVNHVLCEMLGYSADELVGMTFRAITHPEDLDADLALAGRLARGEIPRYRLEKRYIRKDGTIVEVELSASVLRGAGGRPVHFIAQLEDISERKRLEREQEFLAELGPVLASTLDREEILDGVCELATRRLADFCIVDLVENGGVTRMKVASRDPARRFLADALLRLPLDPTRPYLQAEAVCTHRAVLVARPSDDALATMTQGPEHLGIIKAMEISTLVSVPLVASEGVVGAIALIACKGSREYDSRDVRLAEELAWRATMALENARLYHAACEATKARDEVLAIVAHDLRNPLNTIAMQGALLRRRAQPRAGSEANAGETIQRAAARMARLIQDLLDVSRIEAGHLALAQAPLPARSFISECVESQRPLAEAACIELRVDLPDELPELWADRDRLSQVLENLIGNALKFAGGGGCITVSARARESDVLFAVRDTGPGIPAEHLAYVFDRFWQARRAQRQGAGLGLPIVKGVIEAHGGRLWVESPPGQGACFFFTVPRADCRG